MKTLFSILFLIATELSGQELPELNKKILHYADSVMGKHIGKGLCRNFVNKALEYTGKYSIDKKADGDPATLLLWLGGFRVLPENALPGDIICNSLHVGIIYSLEYDFPFCYCEGRCLTIVHQQADGKKTSFVQTGHYCLEKTSYWYYLRP